MKNHKDHPFLQDCTLPMHERIAKAKNLSSEDEWVQGMLLGDEWANCLTHGFGLLLSFIGLFILLITPMQNGDHLKMICLGVYGLSLILLYAASTLYHTVRSPRIKGIFRTIDHCAIYLLIAGSYTPFTLLILGGVWGWTLFAIVWGLALIGITFKIFFSHRFKLLSTSIYLLMGWLVVIATEPLLNSLHVAGLYWLFAGGLFYTAGVIFYVLDKRRFFHAIWHLFVLGGSLCHYLAILFYV